MNGFPLLSFLSVGTPKSNAAAMARQLATSARPPGENVTVHPSDMTMGAPNSNSGGRSGCSHANGNDGVFVCCRCCSNRDDASGTLSKPSRGGCTIWLRCRRLSCCDPCHAKRAIHDGRPPANVQDTHESGMRETRNRKSLEPSHLERCVRRFGAMPSAARVPDRCGESRSIVSA